MATSVESVIESLFQGFYINCIIFALTLLMAIPLGLIISFGSMTKFKPLKWLTRTFVWIIRGIPLMLQIFMVYFIPAAFWGKIDSYFYFNYGLQFGQNGAGVGSFIAVVIAFA